jgi:hypothetical protein
MGKTYNNYIGKNHIHENARPYERTRERITNDINFHEVDDEDTNASVEDTRDDSDSAD